MRMASRLFSTAASVANSFAKLQLDRLMLADRLAERLAHLRIRNRLPERRIRDADPSRRHVDSPQLKTVQDLVQPAPFNAADQSICGYLVVVEAELAGIDALITEFLELAVDC